MKMTDTLTTTWAPRVQGLLRTVAAYLFLLHGSAKLLHIPHMAHFDELQLFSLIGFAGLLELAGGIMLLIGLFTRVVAFILSGEMAFAYFIGHEAKARFCCP